MKRIFGANRVPAEIDNEEYIEVSVMDPTMHAIDGKLGIKVEKLNDFADTERVLKHIRAGNVIFLKIKGLKEKDIGELKRAVEKLKRSISANNGDISGVEQDWLILTPEHAIIHRD